MAAISVVAKSGLPSTVAAPARYGPSRRIDPPFVMHLIAAWNCGPQRVTPAEANAAYGATLMRDEPAMTGIRVRRGA